MDANVDTFWAQKNISDKNNRKLVYKSALKKTTQCWGNTGCDPLPSKGRGEPFERVKFYFC
jgi:hypothetical protein